MKRNVLIELQDVSFRYPGADDWVLQNASLTVHEKEFIAIIGSNGAGKSTLCKTINGLIPHYYVGDFTGAVLLNGKDTKHASVASMSEGIAYVYQDFENQLVRPTVYEEILFSPMNYGFQDYEERAEQTITLLGLESIRDKYIWQLSGGQKHLVALAGALALNPAVLIIDEPVAQLDPAHAHELYEKLKYVHEVAGKTIIVIEHHTEFIASYCKEVVLMDKGTVRWKKPVHEALNSIAELMSLDILPPQVTMAAQETNSHVCWSAPFPITLSEGEKWFKNAVSPRPAVQRVEASSKAPPLLMLEGIQYGYKQLTRKRKTIIDDLHLSIFEKERVALVGSNGAGKSTILKMIARLLKPAKGRVLFEGSVLPASPEKAAEYISYIFQNPEEMFIEDSIRKDVAYYLKARNHPNFEKISEYAMDTFRLQPLRERDGRLLSGGQQRRASLAIGLAMQPSLMLLDEPTASLDIATRKELIKMLQRIDGSVRASVIATHDMQLVAEWATRVIVLHGGRVVADLTPRELFNSPAILTEASLVPPQIVSLSHRLNMTTAALSVEEFKQFVQQEEDSHEQFSNVFSKA
jgi:energy-coupling factor transport system ATP-binding protein